MLQVLIDNFNLFHRRSSRNPGIFLALIVFGMAAIFSACMKTEKNPTSIQAESTGSAQVMIRTGKIGALAKGSSIELSILEVTLTAMGEPPITDSFPMSGSGTANFLHTFSELASLKTWTLTAVSKDLAGKVIHSGSTTFIPLPRKTVDVSLSLNANYSMLRANFFPLRDSTTRVQLLVNHEKVRDSLFAKQSKVGDTLSLFLDYLKTGANEIEMDVFGDAWGFDTLLYTDTKTLDIIAGKDTSYSFSLKWVGPRNPPPGQASMAVTLGAVGTVTVNGFMDANLHWIELPLAGGPIGPVLNSVPAVNYDPGSNRAIVFYPSNPGVSYRFGESSQVWIVTHANGLDGDPEWNRLPVGGTIPDNINAYPSVSYTPNNQLIVYGGCYANCSPAQSSVYILSNANGIGGAAAWSTLPVSNPMTSSSHLGVYDYSENVLVAFGGNQAFFGTDNNTTRVLSGADGASGSSSWRILSPADPLPPPRSETFMGAYDAERKNLIVFGGNNLVRSCCPGVMDQYNDSWVLSHANGVGTPIWTDLNPAGPLPAPRGFGVSVYDPIHNRLIIHGGATWIASSETYEKLDDLWQLENANGAGGPAVWTRLSPEGTGPGAMSLHGAAFDAMKQRLILVGAADPTNGEHPKVWVLAM